MKLRLSVVLLVAIATFAVQAGAAFASATFVAPTDGATVSQSTSFIVDTTGLTGVAGVDIYTNSTGDQSLTQYDGGWSFPADHSNSVDLGSGRYRVDLGIGGWNDGPLTFVAVAVAGDGTQLGTVSENLTIDKSLPALTITSIAPAADSTVSGTFTLTVHAAGENEITDGTYSPNGDTAQPLTLQSPGVFTASIDTTGLANGDLYVEVRLNDEPGNSADNGADQLHLVVQNPVAPTIVPDTLVADKSLFRTDETQLEVGDIVTAYNMEADGFPAPVISYLWNICHGLVCTGVTPGADGDYTVQAADEGATLTLVATATNASGADSTSVDFGVIAPAYVAPVFIDPAPAPAPAPVAPAPPAAVVVVPPVVVPPGAAPPATILAVNPVKQQAVVVAQQAVTAKAAAVVVAEKAKDAADKTVQTAQKQVAAAVDAVAAPTAKPSDKQHLVSTVQALVAAKAKPAKQAAQKKVDAAVQVVSGGTATPSEAKQLVATVTTLVKAKAFASDKAAAAKTAAKKLSAAKQTLVAKKSAAKSP